MTLIAGYVCPDGFVVSADTEITHAEHKYRQSKITESFRKREDPDFYLVMGGAGHVPAMTSAMQRIGRAVRELAHPTVERVHDEIERVIYDDYDHRINPLRQGRPDADAYGFDLLIGLRDVDDHIAMWRTSDRTIVREQHSAAFFIGSGAEVGASVNESLMGEGLPVAVTHHLATEVVKAACSRSTGVGGNIETFSVKQASAQSMGYFAVPDERTFAWALEDLLHSALRCALTARPDALVQRINRIATTLATLADAAQRPFESQDTEWHTTQHWVPNTHPFADF